MGKAYPVGIVGEASYQPAIGRCKEGQQVRILHEPDNPYDDHALAVATDRGETLGYIARDSWLQGAIHEERRGCTASILEVTDAGNGQRGVVIEVTLIGREVGTRAYGSGIEAVEEPVGWLARLFGL